MVDDARHEDQCIEKIIPEERRGLRAGWLIRDPLGIEELEMI